MYVTQTRRAVTSDFVRWCLWTARRTHEEASTITGWSRRTITAWARGERLPSDSHLEVFCKSLDIPEGEVRSFYAWRTQALRVKEYSELRPFMPWSEI